MGAWSYGAFDNDVALDVLEDDINEIRVQNLLECSDDDVLMFLGAGIVEASINGTKNLSLVKEKKEKLEKLKPLTNLIPKAELAIDICLKKEHLKTWSNKSSRIKALNDLKQKLK